VDEDTIRDEWEDAVILYRYGNDKTALITLLRKLYDPHGIPDLNFLADLLEEKPAKGKGRPKENKLRAGIKQARAASTVADLISEQNLTVEIAVERAAENLPMSESSIKKNYLKSLKHKK